MSEKQLVSFGNFLFSKLGLKSYGNTRQVSHADLCNWKEENPNEDLVILELPAGKLPSLKQPGESCFLHFGEGMIADDCEVLKVHFTGNKVQYDVEAILFGVGKREGFNKIRFYNVDEEYVR